MKKILSDDPVFTLHEYGLDVSRNEIHLAGVDTYSNGADPNVSGEPGVEFLMASRFIKNLNIAMNNAVTAQGKLLPIIVHMKTCGGNWQEGMAIYDAIKACPNPVTIVNYTHARSMSSIIFQAASRRVMMPHSYFMMHEGAGCLAGTEKQQRSAFNFFEAIRDQMLDVYVGRAKDSNFFHGWSRTRIKEFFADKMNNHEEWYLWAKDAVRYGLADEVFTSWHSIRKGK